MTENLLGRPERNPNPTIEELLTSKVIDRDQCLDIIVKTPTINHFVDPMGALERINETFKQLDNSQAALDDVSQRIFHDFFPNIDSDKTKPITFISFGTGLLISRDKISESLGVSDQTTIAYITHKMVQELAQIWETAQDQHTKQEALIGMIYFTAIQNLNLKVRTSTNLITNKHHLENIHRTELRLLVNMTEEEMEAEQEKSLLYTGQYKPIHEDGGDSFLIM